MEEEYNELLEYATIVKKALTAITHDDNMAEDDKVQVLYATTPMAFAKIKENIKNGTKSGPLVTFYLSKTEISNNQMGGWKVLNTARDDSFYQFRAPVIMKLTYTTTVNCINESQADLLQRQILLSMPLNRPYWDKLNGQWVTMVASDPENLSSVDVGENKDKFSRRQITITIERAYLEHPYLIKDKKTDQQIGIWLNSEEVK